MPDGTCKRCPAYQKANESGYGCAVPDCGAKQRVMPDATCELCPDF